MNPWTAERHAYLLNWARQMMFFHHPQRSSSDARRPECLDSYQHFSECVAALREIERLQEQELKLKGDIAQLECSVETLCGELKTHQRKET